MSINSHQDSDLTVVLPNYNHARFLPCSLRSILSQTKPPSRIIVQDDQSEDSSREIVSEFARKHKRIELIINPKRLGVNGNANAGLKMVDTEFVTFLAADDFVHESLYETAISCLKAHKKSSVCVTAVQWVNEAGECLHQPGNPPVCDTPAYFSADETFKLLTRHGSFLAGTGSVYSTAALKDLGGFSERLGSYSDTFTQHLLITRGGLCYIPWRLACWRRLENGYAIATDRNAVAWRRILDGIADWLRKPEAASIPVDYRRVFVDRLKFSCVRAALADPRVDTAQLTGFVDNGATGRFITLAARLGGMPCALAAAMVTLRRRDILPAIRRRIAAKTPIDAGHWTCKR